MDRFIIWFIRNRLWLHIVILIVVVFIFYSFFSPNECTYDFWKIITYVADYISNSNLPAKWNHFLLTLIFLSIPIIIISALSVYFFPIRPWKILKLIGEKRNNSAKLCYALLETQLNVLVDKIHDLNKGIKVSHEEANQIQEKILPIVSKSDWYITTILEPDVIWNDPNHKNSIEYTISNAKGRQINLTRFIVTHNIDNLKRDADIEGTPMNELAKLHVNYNCSLKLVEQSKFEKCFSSCGIDKEYLDFLLVEDEVIYGLKNKVTFTNGNTIYETITENETYLLFIKDTPKDLDSYKKLINKLLQSNNHFNLQLQSITP